MATKAQVFKLENGLVLIGVRNNQALGRAINRLPEGILVGNYSVDSPHGELSICKLSDDDKVSIVGTIAVEVLTGTELVIPDGAEPISFNDAIKILA